MNRKAKSGQVFKFNFGVNDTISAFLFHFSYFSSSTYCYFYICIFFFFFCFFPSWILYFGIESLDLIFCIRIKSIADEEAVAAGGGGAVVAQAPLGIKPE